ELGRGTRHDALGPFESRFQGGAVIGNRFLAGGWLCVSRTGALVEPEVRWLDRATPADDASALDPVLQLTHVPWPIVREERRARGGRKRRRRRQIRSVSGEESLGHGQDVV